MRFTKTAFALLIASCLISFQSVAQTADDIVIVSIPANVEANKNISIIFKTIQGRGQTGVSAPVKISVPPTGATMMNAAPFLHNPPAITSTTVTTGADGTWEINAPVNGVLSSFTITLTLLTNNKSVSKEVRILPAVQQSISLTRLSTVSQTTFVNQDFLEPLQVKLVIDGVPKYAASIEIIIGGTGASGFIGVNGKRVLVTTDRSGVATVPVIKANNQSGSFTVSAVYEQKTVKFILTNAALN